MHGSNSESSTRHSTTDRALVAVPLTSISPVLANDLEAVGLTFDAKGDNLYNVTALIDFSIVGDLSFDSVEYLIVVGDQVVVDSTFNAPDDNPDIACPSNCTGSCKALGNGGTCGIIPTGEAAGLCGCIISNNVAVGSPVIISDPSVVVSLVLDPNNLIAEFDETNNVFQTTLAQRPPIPTVSAWGLIVLALMLAVPAKLYFGRRLQRRS